MAGLTEQEINSLVEKFKNKNLPKEVWTHEAHLLVAIWHNWHFEFEQALDEVREGIKTYNEAVGTANTTSSGYHESITILWMRIAKRFLLDHQFETIETAATAFLQSSWSTKSLPLEYYSRTVLFSENARLNGVAPDLKALP